MFDWIRPARLRRASVSAACVAASLLAATSPAAAQMDASRRDLTIATASPGGNYFLTGNALCRALQRQGLYLDSGDVTLINCATMATSGSIQNVDLLRTRVVDVALVQSDWQYHAFRGSDRFAGRKLDQMRALVSFNREAFQMLAGRGTQIERWGDLKSKKVNLGPNGSTANTMFLELFKVHGVDEKWLTQALRLPPTAHVQEMCEGNIEALAQVSGVPNSGVADAVRRCNATLVKLDTDEIRKMVRDLPYYTPVTIPKGTYAEQADEAQTFGVVATLVATADLPDQVAYSIVRAVFEGLDDMKAQVPALRGVFRQDMVSTGMTAPLHPGVLRYYREAGLIKTEGPKTATAMTDPAAAFKLAPGEPTTVEAEKPLEPFAASTATQPAAKAARSKSKPKASRQ